MFLPMSDDEKVTMSWVPREVSLPLEPKYGDHDLVIGANKRVLVVIRPDGSLEYGPEYTPDKAATAFWEEMARLRLETEERLLLIQHMEATLVRLGAADLRNEETQRQMGLLPSQESMRAVGQAQAVLEKAMHLAIELGRGLAKRDVTQPPPPTRIPARIAEDEDNSYDPYEKKPKRDPSLN